MGTFAERASADYCYHFSAKKNHTSIFCLQTTQKEVCCFHFFLQQTNGSCRFPLVYCIYIYNIEIYAAFPNGKKKTKG
jgi:hypothetical protein